MKVSDRYRQFVLLPLLALVFAGAAVAAEHGYIAPLPEPEPRNNLFEVNIEQINGKDAMDGPNFRAPAGKNEVVVSLVFSSEWGSGMSYTGGQIYYNTIEVDVEEGKTYYLGAKVDTSASEEAQVDGSFWTPVIVKVR